ncbi:MAG: hypothetical protein EBU46_04770 [Nitrosomonadaceae bacterium]|nr:hypothetical protein [Nitrosomonadaceae bacterium]
MEANTIKFAALYQLAAYVRDNWAGAKSAQLDSILDQMDGLDEPESEQNHKDVVLLLQRLNKLLSNKDSQELLILRRELDNRIKQYGSFLERRAEKCMSPLQWKFV